MPSLVVGDVSIPVAISSPAFSRADAVDRGRVFDNSYFASQTGGAANDWTFTTTPVTTALAATYEAALSIVSAQLCSGDILELPTMCHAEFLGGTPVRTGVGHRVILNFALHEALSATVLLRYAPGDTLTGESFTRSTVGRYRSVTGNSVASAAINVKRDAHYDLNDLIANSPSLLLEDTRTNIAVSPRDLTNAAWTKTTMTATLNQIGVDGVANSATALVATAANATCGQLVTLASSQRSFSAFVFRGIGTGPVEMTTDGGTTWTPITLGAVGVYARYTIPAQTVTNPNFGFRIVTNGDAIGVDFVLNETGPFPSSPIDIAGGVRGTDLYPLLFTPPPGESTFYLKFIELGTIGLPGATALLIGNAASANPVLAIYNPGGFYTAYHHNGVTSVTSALSVAPVINNTVELALRLSGDGSVNISQSINGAAETISAQSAALAFAAAWSGALLWPNSSSGGVRGFAAYKSIKVAAGARSLAEMRSL